MANDVIIPVSGTNYTYTEIVGAPKGQTARGDLTNGSNAAPRKLFTGFTPGGGSKPDRALMKLQFTEVNPDDSTKAATYGLHIVGERPRASHVSDADMLFLRDTLFAWASDESFLGWLKGKL